MTKLALFVLVVGAIAVGFFHTAETYTENRQRVQLNALEEDEEDRSGASFAYSQSNRASGISTSPHPPMPNQGPGSFPTPVECYSCTDCPKVLPNTTSKLCPLNFDRSKLRTCVVYAEQYKHMKRPWYVRGCASERGSCADIRQAHAGHEDIVDLLLCHECEGDRCNTGSGAYRSLSDITMALMALLVTPLIAKYTLS